MAKVMTLKLGDKFTASSVTGEDEDGSGGYPMLTLHDVIVDKNDDSWAIGLGSNGEPWVVAEGEVDDLMTTIYLPEKGRK